MWRSRAWRVLTVVLVSAGGVTGCSGGDEDEPAEPATTRSTQAPEAVQAAYADGEPLAVVRDVAERLEGVEEANAAELCAAAVADLDAVGTPDEVTSLAATAGDAKVEEAALEQQAAVSSLLAACRGDAPVSVTDAAAELAVSNDALDALLTERGVPG